MKIYVDSSAIVALMFEEQGTKDLQAYLRKSSDSLSSLLLEAEVYAVACREQTSLEIPKNLIQTLNLVLPDRSLQPEYFEIFKAGYSRGADAFHLATALFLDPQRSHLHFLTLDKNQGEMAQKLGFKVIPYGKN